MGEKTMKPTLEIDKNTHVAFCDVVDEIPSNAKIRMIDVSDQLGLKSQVMARVDIQNGIFLGLMIEDYPAFRREVMKKFVALHVERIMELIVSSVRGIVNVPQNTSDDHRS